MFPSGGEVLKDGHVFATIQVFLNARVLNNILLLKEVGHVLKDNQVLINTQILNNGHVSTTTNNGGVIMESKDVSIKGFNSNFVNFLQVQTK
jgi:hypothetical protein